MTLLASLLLAATLDAPADAARVTPDQLKAMLEKGTAIAVDVRGTVPWELGHIAGAVWMPIGLMSQRGGELPTDKLLVTYCTCKAEETSLEAARVLSTLGFERVAVLTGGYPAWKNAGFAVESTREPQAVSQETAPAGRGRLAPPAAVPCDRNQLTSYEGRVRTYERDREKTLLVLETTHGTVERVTLRHSASGTPLKWYLIAGTPATEADWNRIETTPGKLHDGMGAIAWVCEDGTTLIDWRPAPR